jgi:predicted ATPase
VKIDFEPLTVLVGGNATGKSSVLRGICAPFADSRDRWMRQPVAVVIGHEFGDGRRPCRFELPLSGPFSQSARPTCTSQLLQFDLAQLRSANQLARAGALDQVGGNLPNTFASLTRKHQLELVERFCRAVQMFRDVDVLPVGGGMLTLRFQDRWNENVWYTPDQVSDGTMLVLAYLLLMYQQPQVELVAIEEPERGLHPYLLGELIKFFRAMTRGEVGPRPVQVVLATHSAGILDHLEPREVRLLSRDRTSGEVRVETIDESTENWRRAYEEYEHSLGGIWLSGGIGGTPAS